MEDTIVSITRKVLTAVTTAAMLAGLFGSAFVPSVMAAGQASSSGIPKANRTDVEHIGWTEDAGTIHKWATGKYAFLAGESNLDESPSSDSTLGFQIYDTTGAALTSLDSLKAVSSNSDILVSWEYFAATDDPAGAGAATGYWDGDGTDGTDTAIVDGDGFAEGFRNTCDDLDTDYFGTTSLVTDVNQSNDYNNSFDDLDSGDTIDANGDGTYVLCIAAASEESAATGTITVTANGVVVKTVTMTVVGPIDSLTISKANGFNYVAEDNSAIDAGMKIVAKDAAGTVINGGAGTPWSAQLDGNCGEFYGQTEAQIARVIATSGWEDAPMYTDVCGYDYDLTQNKVYDNDANAITTNSDHQNGDEVVFFADNNEDWQYADATDSQYDPQDTGLQWVDLEADMCVSETASGDDDGDAGHVLSLKIRADDNDEGDASDVTSNAMTVTCTGNSDGAKISGLSAEATSGLLDYDEAAPGDDLLRITGTFTDAAGRPLGDGAGTINLAPLFEGESDAFTADLGWIAAGPNLTAAKGVAKVGTLSPVVPVARTYKYTITLQANDIAAVGAGDCLTEVDEDDVLVDDTGCVAKDYAFTYKASVNATDFVVTGKVTRNAAKTRARVVVNLGLDYIGQLVDFDLEYMNGNVQYVSRRVNAAGNAVLILVKRNTVVTVSAWDADELLWGHRTLTFR